LKSLSILADELINHHRESMSAFDEFEICRDILESLLTGVCVLDLHKRIVYWSAGAERITGHSRHEVVGRCCVDQALLHCDQKGCEFCSAECPLAVAIRTSQPVEATGLLHHKSGYEVPVHIHAVPVHNQHGSIIGAAETFESIEQSDANNAEKVLPGCVDQVTGLASQARMQSHLREALGAFTDLQVPFGVLQFRLQGQEHFRAAFGPDAAASFLRVIARTLASDLGRTDFVGRWAENEFLMILNGSREEAVYTVRERLRRMLANDSIDWWGERRSVPVSIAVAIVQSGDSIESLLGRAQQALNAPSARLTRTTIGGSNSSGS